MVVIMIVMIQENTNEYNHSDSGLRDFDDTALKHNIFILRVYFKSIKHTFDEPFQGAFEEEVNTCSVCARTIVISKF